jgi:predicted DCC family thiol-disulfide oxidoreductase YuxK
MFPAPLRLSLRQPFLWETHMATSTRHSRRAAVFFDGDCAFCRRSIALLQRLDWLHRLVYVNSRERDNPLLANPALDHAPLLEEMHLLTPDGTGLYHGFGAVRWLAWRLPALWPIAPFLYVPGVPTLGQKLYLWVARHRFRLVPCHGGVCTIQRRETHP